MALSGDVKALIQANNGHVLAGTNNSARIYRSTDNGQNWTNTVTLGSSTDSVNAFAKINSSGWIFAAVTGSSGAQGIWRSEDHGNTWLKVFSHPSGADSGYYDITAIRGGNNLVAVGPPTASSFSPIITSSNAGSSWSYASTIASNLPHLAVSAYLEGTLFTLYPGESYGDVFAFYGVDSIYTGAGGVRLNGTTTGFGNTGGPFGSGGLDIVSFLVKNPSNSFYRRALWAVKSHLNTADTEIWQWPASPAGPFSFAKIATINSENLRGLYIDTTPDYTSAQRTIWAGGNGSIYVSYNSGLTWAVATAAPTGQVYSFVRTASGVLISGGADGEIFLFGSGGSEGGGNPGPPPDPPPDPPPPEPPVEPEEPEEPSIVTTRYLGSTATCNDEVYVANRFSFSNITHIFYFNGSDYINLQFGSEPPYSLLGATPAVNRAVYFGSRTSDSNIPGGAYSSLVFNITWPAADITIGWEYWDGSSWEPLAVQDNSNGFISVGPTSVHWQIPTDWATVAVNGVTGYWVRARVSAVGSNPSGPVHSTRYIYTPNLPYVEIADSEIGGDMPALAQVIWANRGDKPGGSPAMEVHRVFVGLRSVDRGPAFDAYVNFADTQVPFGVTLTTPKGGFEGSALAPTSRRYSVSYSSGGDLNAWADLIRISLSTTIARDYYGNFRVFLRGYITPGDADDWRFRLALGFGSGGVVSYSREQFGKPAQVDFRLFDMGSLHIPNAAMASNHVSDELTITVQGYATATNVAAKLYDLILLPLDEWAGDFVHTNTNASIPSGISGANYLDIDSIGNPKSPLNAYNRTDSGLVKAIYQPVANGEAILQVGQRQRLWFLAAQYAFASSSWGALPTVTGAVRVNRVQQYLGLRGAG